MALPYLYRVNSKTPTNPNGFVLMLTINTYKILTLTHKCAPLKMLGKFVLPEQEVQAQLQTLRQALGIEELLYLATCNRILFVFTNNCELDQTFIQSFFNAAYSHLTAQEREEAAALVAAHQGEAAITHLFEVASSIDSLVVGEREILRQLRTAYDQCLQWGLTGDCIRIAMRFTVEAAKKVYSQTRIGEKPVSVVSLAIQRMLEHRLTPNTRFLIVGAGQTNTLVAKFLIKNKFTQFAVFNRTLTRAQELAALLQGESHSLDALAQYDKGFDVLIACTGATEAVITPEVYQQLLAGDQQTPKVLIDLSIPHNIDAQVVTNNNCHYIQIEDLQQLAQENLAFRQHEVAVAQTLLQTELEAFCTAFQARQIERALSGVPEQIKAIRQHALENVFRREVESLDDASRSLLNKVMEYMEKRCIAIPIQVAKERMLG